MKIFVAGNRDLDQDSIALKVADELRITFPEIEFQEFDPADEMKTLGKDPIILDAVSGLDFVKVIRDIDLIESGGRVSMHDFDLGTNIKIMKKLGYINSVTIIGIPQQESLDKAIDQVERIIRKLILGKD